MWQLTHPLGGPVLSWELLRAERRRVSRVLRYAYLTWLLLQFLIVLTPSGLPQSLDEVEQFLEPIGEGATPPPRRDEAFTPERATGYVSLLLYQQLVVLVLLTPALTAGAFGYEKERDTLTALFGTDLTARAIVTGKLLARLVLLADVTLAALPFLAIMASLGELTPGQLLLALAQAAVLTFALGAVCLLASVWTRRTSDALLACYATITLAFFAGQVLLAATPLPGWLDPFEALGRLLAGQGAAMFGHLAVWGGTGALCLTLAVLRLRPAGLRQLEHRPPRWLWAFRPGIGDAPVRWRERYVIGLAPFPWLRFVPGWLALLGVFGFSAVLAYSAFASLLGPGSAAAVSAGDFTRVRDVLAGLEAERVIMEVIAMGLVLAVIGTVVVGVRCGGSIAEEKRRKTWDDLVLTPLPLEEIVRDKTAGVLHATIPYLAVYAVPMLLLGTLGGFIGIMTAVGCLIITWFAVSTAATVGMGISAAKEDRPRQSPRAVSVRGWGPDTARLPPVPPPGR
jgi:hypothetical protein